MTTGFVLAYYEKDGKCVTGLTPLVYVRSVALADADIALVTDGEEMLEVGDGVYAYRLPDLDFAAHWYPFTARAAGADVDTEDVAGLVHDFALVEMVDYGVAAAGDAMTLETEERTTLAGVVDGELSATHGAGSWETATGFAVPGSEMDLVAAPNATALGAVADANWQRTERTLTSFGTLVANMASAVWNVARRTLTMSAAELRDVLTGGAWTLTRGTTWLIDVTLDVDLSGMGVGDQLVWTLKEKPEKDPDTAAVMQVTLAAGLVRLNGTSLPVGSAGLATLEIRDAEIGAVRLRVSELINAQLRLLRHANWDFVWLTPAPSKVLLGEGLLTVRREVTRRLA